MPKLIRWRGLVGPIMVMTDLIEFQHFNKNISMFHRYIYECYITFATKCLCFAFYWIYVLVILFVLENEINIERAG